MLFSLYHKTEKYVKHFLSAVFLLLTYGCSNLHNAAELPPLKMSVFLGSEMTLREQQFFPAYPVEQRGAMRYTTQKAA
jgi:hypothetical protein